MNRRRLPAEWEKQHAVLMAWPHAHTDWLYMLAEAQMCISRIVEEIATTAYVLIATPVPEETLRQFACSTNRDRIHIVKCPTNDTWARDFGFITCLDGSRPIAYDFKFNGWGLKFPACYDNLINRNIFASSFVSDKSCYVNRLGFVLEGGAIDCDGNGTMLTTEACLLSPNRNGQMSKAEIETALKSDFSLEKIAWLKHGYLAGDDTDSHIDTLARFMPDNAIAYTACDRPDDEHYHELKAMEKELEDMRDCMGNPYKLVELPIPEPIFDEDGLRLPATYANFLFINGKMLLPVYNDEHYDKIALTRLAKALPEYEIVPIDCRALIQQHGSLHCCTMQIPPGVFNMD